MPLHIESQVAYSAFLTEMPDGEHEATPFMEFIAQIVKTSAVGAQIAVEGNMLDIVLSIYVGGFLPYFPAYKSSSLFLVCNALLSNIYVYSETRQCLSSHPVHILWPRRVLAPLTETVQRQIVDRRTVWRDLTDPTLITRRIASVRRLLTLPLLDIPDFPPVKRDFPDNAMSHTTTDIFDDCVDMVEFIRSVDHQMGGMKYLMWQTGRISTATISSIVLVSLYLRAYGALNYLPWIPVDLCWMAYAPGSFKRSCSLDLGL
jgi:hypothetical protein